MRRLALAALAAAAIAVAAACLLLFKLPGAELPWASTPPPPVTPAPGVVYELRLEAGEGGELLVNGSAVKGSVVGSKPLTVVLEAKPHRCFTLKQLLVNGSPVEGSRLVLRIEGNTTVRAVFTRACAFVSFEVVGEGSLLVNGTAVPNGSRLEVPLGSTLAVLVEAPENVEASLYVNESKLPSCPACRALCPGCPPPPLFITVKGDTKLSAVFEPRIVVLHIDTGGLPALVSSSRWSQAVNGTATLGVEAGSFVNITTFCRPEGEEFFCVLGWLLTYTAPTGPVNTTAPPNTTLHLTSDTTLKAYTAKVKSTPPQPARGAVLLNGKEVPANMYPSPFMLRGKPWSAKFEYVGDGTWLIDEPIYGALFLELPVNWSKAVVEVWVDYRYWGIPFITVEVVVSEYPWQRSVGRWSSGEPLKPGAYFRIVFTRSGEVLETPENWWPCEGKWVERNPMAKEGWLYILVDELEVKVRVTVQP